MNQLTDLAKKSVENYINYGKIISVPEDFPKDFLKRKAGTFVTIERDGRLRGCIGTYLATRNNIAEEIIYNAIAAATEDYRFGQINKEELPCLSYIVYILGEPEDISDINELNPKKFGIIVRTEGFEQKSGLLLPDLDGVDTAEQQIDICCQKGGIDLKKEKIKIYRFEAEKYDSDK